MAKKSTVDKSLDPNKEIRKYLSQTNRPYNATDVQNNLKGKLSKAQVVKALADLAANGVIHQKVMGKQTIYVQKQDDLPCPDPEELRSLDKEIEAIREKLSVLKEEVKSKTASLSTLKGSKTTSQIKESIEAIKIENQQMTDRLTNLQSGNVKPISPAEKAKIDKDYELMRKEWSSRKKMFNNIWGQITNADLLMKPKDIMEEAGIETDEMVNADLKKDPLVKA
jgi:26S proteasome regulatory subunit (ATPase 3-interacting protein)